MSYHTAAALLDRGPSRPTLYSVRIPGISGYTNRYLGFYCQVTAIPEVRIDTVLANGHENMGIVREQPTNVIYGKPFEMTVIENPRFSVYKEMRNWLDSTTFNANQNGNLLGFGRSQRQQYYNTFVRDMELRKLEQGWQNMADQPDDEFFDDYGYDNPLTVKFINAYPISISAIQLGSEMNDLSTTFTISFTYESYNVRSSIEDGANSILV